MAGEAEQQEHDRGHRLGTGFHLADSKTKGERRRRSEGARGRTRVITAEDQDGALNVADGCIYH